MPFALATVVLIRSCFTNDVTIFLRENRPERREGERIRCISLYQDQDQDQDRDQDQDKHPADQDRDQDQDQDKHPADQDRHRTGPTNMQWRWNSFVKSNTLRAENKTKTRTHTGEGGGGGGPTKNGTVKPRLHVYLNIAHLCLESLPSLRPTRRCFICAFSNMDEEIRHMKVER